MAMIFGWLRQFRRWIIGPSQDDSLFQFYPLFLPSPSMVQKIKRVHCSSKDLGDIEIPAEAKIISFKEQDAYAYIWYSIIEESGV